MGKIVYTEEQNKFILENCNKYYLDELTRLFNKKFNENKSYDSMKNKVKNMTKNYKLRDKKENLLKRKSLFNEEEHNFLKENRNQYNSLEELRNAFNENFNRNITYNSIKAYCGRHNLLTEGRRKPHTYTKEELEWTKNNYQKYMLEKRFDNDKFREDFYNLFNHKLIENDIRNLIVIKLGIELPYNQKMVVKSINEDLYPIGYEVFNKNAWYVKVAYNKIEHNKNRLCINYRRKANVMYEKYNNVKIDDKKQIVFMLNGDKNDFSKENLISVDKDVNKSYNSKYKSSNNEFQNVKLKKLALMNIQLKHIIDNLK